MTHNKIDKAKAVVSKFIKYTHKNTLPCHISETQIDAIKDLRAYVDELENRGEYYSKIYSDVKMSLEQENKRLRDALEKLPATEDDVDGLHFSDLVDYIFDARKALGENNDKPE